MTTSLILAGETEIADRRPLRQLAASGDLWRTGITEPAEVSRLRSEAFEIALPLVWERHTRGLEMRKGHRRCTTAISALPPECLDGFTDDLEAVVTGLLAYRRPIASVEGWITMRMGNAIKDGHRVRRAKEMGAQQRVRVPSGLAARLGGDPWLLALAERVLQWTGVRQAAGSDLWPIGQWTEDRAAITRIPESLSVVSVTDQVSMVLAAMKEWDAAWYDRYVEQPLGRKWAPPTTDSSDVPENSLLDLVPEYERAEGRLIDSAATCLEAIRAALGEDYDPCEAVENALIATYLIDWKPTDLDQVPSTSYDVGDVVTAIMTDRGTLDRVTAEVLDIVAFEQAPPVR
jgi:hypothetical protein